MWLPDKLAKQLELMKASNAAFCYTAIEMMDCSGNQVKSQRSIPTFVDYRYLLRNTVIATSSVVVDRWQLGNFRMPLYRSGQDYATWLMLLRRLEGAVGLNEVLVRYRVGGKSLSSNKWKSLAQVWDVQVHQEGINRLDATFHVGCFAWNAFKKYVL